MTDVESELLEQIEELDEITFSEYPNIAEVKALLLLPEETVDDVSEDALREAISDGLQRFIAVPNAVSVSIRERDTDA